MSDISGQEVPRAPRSILLSKPYQALAVSLMTLALYPVALRAAERGATPRHLAAQKAGLQALHLCSGYFATEAPRSLIDATIDANAPASLSPSPTSKPQVDEKARTVSVRYVDDMPPRIAVARAGMGCTMLPIGATLSLSANLFSPGALAPDLDARPWPLGDVGAVRRLPTRPHTAISRAIHEAFRDEAGAYGGITWGVVVVHRGKIVAERYGRGFGPHIAARTNSMCKSLGGTLVGLAARKGLVDLHRPGPLAEWRTAGDPRGAITLDDLLHMGSGLYSDGAQDPQKEIYQSGASISEVAARNIVDAVPGRRFVYAGTDTNLAMRAVRQALANDVAYPAFPYRELLWKIGMTRTVIETDWNNDFIVSGQCWSTARDFARLSLLYLADGKWDKQRLLPPGWTRYAATPAPAQPAKPSIGGDAGYGAQFWLFGGMNGLPSDAFSAFGAMGQYAVIVPSADTVIIRRGFDRASPFKIQKFAADIIAALPR